ncbi:MAG: metallophosphoesterase [Candidatus Caldarchaeum sp.]
MLGRGRQLYRELISIALSEGYQITEKALKIFEESETPVEDLMRTIEYIKKHDPELSIIDAEHIVRTQPVLEKTQNNSRQVVEETTMVYTPNIMIQNSVEENQRIEGSVEEFRHYFQNRYYSIRRLLERRRLNFIPVSEAFSVKDGEEVYLAVMVQGKRERKNSVAVEVDDPSGVLTVVVPRKNQQLYKQTAELLNDVVLGLKVRRAGNLYVLREIIYPDVEEMNYKNLPPAPEAYVCLISDVHVGSKNFRKDLFEKFLDWLSRGRDGVVKRISHIVVDGDLVEGVGVYPGQENDLLVKNVEDQLKQAADLLAEIPERIEIVFSPGNHEPVRKAIPQPPLQTRYREIVNAKRKVHFVSNPATLVFDGRRILAYHGQGLDELIQSLPDVSYSNLKETAPRVIASMLRFRHLAPVYGENTQLMPTEEDRLVISEQPHLLQTGHIHVTVNTSYRGVLLVNAGAWQDQTDYQKSMGLEPMVGYAALLNIARMTVQLKYFGA